MSQLSSIDFLLFILYAFLYWKFVQYRANKLEDEILAKYLRQSYRFRVLCSFLLSMFVLFLSPSDASGIFFPEANNIYHQILAHPQKIDFFINAWADNADISPIEDINVPYFSGANFIVIKFIVAFNFLSFGNFITNSFLFSLLAFEGAWQLFKFFNAINPSLKKYTAICFLFIPTYIFWTSGIVKEALSIFCLGYISFSLYRIFVSFNAIFTRAFVIILLSVLLYNVKSYTIISYAPLLVYFLVKLKISNSSANSFLKYSLSSIFIIAIIIGAGYFINSDSEALHEFQFDTVTQTIESQQTQFKIQAEDAASSFNLGAEFDPSPVGMLKAFPFAITATFFRPFIWEAKKLTVFISALESLFLLISTLYVMLKCGFFYFFKKIFNDPLILFCFLFAIIFGFFCGISTLNFGSLVRYKLPSIPFFLYALVLIYLSKSKVYQRRNIAV